MNRQNSKSQKNGNGLIRSGLSVQELKAITALRVGVATDFGAKAPNPKIPQSGVRSYQTANASQLVAAGMMLHSASSAQVGNEGINSSEKHLRSVQSGYNLPKVNYETQNNYHRYSTQDSSLYDPRYNEPMIPDLLSKKTDIYGALTSGNSGYHSSGTAFSTSTSNTSSGKSTPSIPRGALNPVVSNYPKATVPVGTELVGRTYQSGLPYPDNIQQQRSVSKDPISVRETLRSGASEFVPQLIRGQDNLPPSTNVDYASIRLQSNESALQSNTFMNTLSLRGDQNEGGDSLSLSAYRLKQSPQVKAKLNDSLSDYVFDLSTAVPPGLSVQSPSLYSSPNKTSVGNAQTSNPFQSAGISAVSGPNFQLPSLNINSPTGKNLSGLNATRRQGGNDVGADRPINQSIDTFKGNLNRLNAEDVDTDSPNKLMNAYGMRNFLSSPSERMGSDVNLIGLEIAESLLNAPSLSPDALKAKKQNEFKSNVLSPLNSNLLSPSGITLNTDLSSLGSPKLKRLQSAQTDYTSGVFPGAIASSLARSPSTSRAVLSTQQSQLQMIGTSKPTTPSTKELSPRLMDTWMSHPGSIDDGTTNPATSPSTTSYLSPFRTKNELAISPYLNDSQDEIYPAALRRLNSDSDQGSSIGDDEEDGDVAGPTTNQSQADPDVDGHHQVQMTGVTLPFKYESHFYQ